MSRSRSARRMVFIVEDHPVTRQGLVSLLKEQPDLFVCGEAATTQEAFEAVPAAEPDVVLTDLTLEDGSGLELVKHFHERLPGLKILVVSMHDEALYAERVLRAGARGYVMKNASASVLVEAIRVVLQGRIYTSDAIRDRMLEMKFWTGHEEGTSPLDVLSDRELETFRYLGEGCSTREIAARMDITVQTVGTYRERIKQKLGFRNASELIRRAVAWVENG